MLYAALLMKQINAAKLRNVKRSLTTAIELHVRVPTRSIKMTLLKLNAFES